MEPSSSPLVLVVDDNVDGREICAEYLKYCGYRVETAVDGLEALEKISALSPDVVVLDLSMPGLDGWEVTRRLRTDEKTRGIRILAHTAHALHGHDAEVLAAGCDAVVTKPCEPKDLKLEVERQLAAGRRDAPLGAGIPAAPTAEAGALVAEPVAVGSTADSP